MISAAPNNTLEKNGSTYIWNNRVIQRGTRLAGKSSGKEGRGGEEEYRGQAVIFVWDSQVFYEHWPLNAHERSSLEICVFSCSRSIFPGSSLPGSRSNKHSRMQLFLTTVFFDKTLWDSIIARDRSTFLLCFRFLWNTYLFILYTNRRQSTRE